MSDKEYIGDMSDKEYIGDMSDKEYQRKVLVEHGILAVSDKC